MASIRHGGQSYNNNRQCSDVVHARPGLLAEQLLGLRVVDQDLVQVFLVQDEEIGKTMSDHIGCASVAPTYCQQTAGQREGGGEINVPFEKPFSPFKFQIQQ